MTTPTTTTITAIIVDGGKYVHALYGTATKITPCGVISWGNAGRAVFQSTTREVNCPRCRSTQW